MTPDSASTRYASRPQRSKIRLYASSCLVNAASSPASSASNVYESFMMNSRRRRRPPRGRGSSRSLVEKWYQTCGSCLYDWISRARNVIDSSCVHESTNGRPPLSFRWKRIGTSMRPVVSQSSAGVSVGARISWPPIASISSRMICSIRMCTRQPSGSIAQRPAPIWRMKPPRTSSWCDAASASAGGSRRVGRKSCEARAIIGVVALGYSSGIREASAMARAAGFAILRRFGRCIPSAIHLSISWNSSSIRMSELTFFRTRPCA